MNNKIITRKKNDFKKSDIDQESDQIQIQHESGSGQIRPEEHFLQLILHEASVKSVFRLIDGAHLL